MLGNSRARNSADGSISFSCEYASARDSGGIQTDFSCNSCPYFIPLPLDESNHFSLRSVSYRFHMGTSALIKQVQSAVFEMRRNHNNHNNTGNDTNNNNENNDGWLILVFHEIGDNYDSSFPTAITLREFTDFLDHLSLIDKDQVEIVPVNRIIGNTQPTTTPVIPTTTIPPTTPVIPTTTTIPVIPPTTTIPVIPTTPPIIPNTDRSNVIIVVSVLSLLAVAVIVTCIYFLRMWYIAQNIAQNTIQNGNFVPLTKIIIDAGILQNDMLVDEMYREGIVLDDESSEYNRIIQAEFTKHQVTI